LSLKRDLSLLGYSTHENRPPSAVFKLKGGGQPRLARRSFGRAGETRASLLLLLLLLYTTGTGTGQEAALPHKPHHVADNVNVSELHSQMHEVASSSYVSNVRSSAHSVESTTGGGGGGGGGGNQNLTRYAFASSSSCFDYFGLLMR
jgi:hypothetical protein